MYLLTFIYKMNSSPGISYKSVVLQFILGILICITLITNSMAKDMTTFKLSAGNRTIQFAIPADYEAKTETESLTEIHCKYPEMTPLPKGNALQSDSIKIFIRISKQTDSTERFVAEALKRPDENRRALQYWEKRVGDYDLYRQAVTKGSEALIYVFKAHDGFLVSVRDSFLESPYHDARRGMGDDIHIRYLIAKGIGKDFIEIDEQVTKFIRSLIDNY